MKVDFKLVNSRRAVDTEVVMNSRKAFLFACSISSLVVLIVIVAIIVAASTTKKQNVATENGTTEISTTEIAPTEIVIPDDYTEKLIQGVRDGDLDTVKNLLAMTNDHVDIKPNDNE